jgi:5'-nucleotidase
MVPGNHEFNYGLERLLELSDMMNFPLLAANITTADGNTLFQPYAVFPMNGVKVGVFGLITPETVGSTDSRNITGLIFESPAAVAAEMVAVLKSEGCDVIIALTHMGTDDSSAAANRSDSLAGVPGIDVIIDGHSHTKWDKGLLVNGALIAQAGEHGRHIGIVEITVKSGVVSKSARLIEINDTLAADNQIVNLIAELDAENEALTSAVVGNSNVFLDGERENVRAGETNLANLITDSMRWVTGADIAILNGGGIRSSVPAGNITMGHVLNVLPFSNLLVTIELSGADILRALEYGVNLYPEPDGRYIQVSGIRFEFDPNAESGKRVRSVRMSNGSAFNVNRIYTVSTIEFLLFDGEGYELVFTNGTNRTYYGDDAEAFANYLRTMPVIKAEAESRVSIAAGGMPMVGENNSVLIWFFIGGICVFGLGMILRRAV